MHRSRAGHGSSLAIAALGVLATLALGACRPYQNVGIVSVPEGAEVYLDGHMVGVTPLRLRIATQAHHKVYLKKEGYRPELLVLNSHQPQDRIDFLTPADLRVRLMPLVAPLPRELEVEGEEADR